MTLASTGSKVDNVGQGKTLHEFCQSRTSSAMAVARGEQRVAPDEPKLWFTSTQSFAKVLSAGNRDLLRRGGQAEPCRDIHAHRQIWYEDP